MTEITAEQKKQLLKLEGFKQIRDQFVKEQKQAGSGKKRMHGRGFWDSVAGWFRSAGQNVNDFLKRTKLISNVAGAILPILAPLGTALLTANPLAAAASVGAAKAATQGISSLGYGLKGGDSRLAINLPNQRLRPAVPRMKGKGGLTFGYNGTIQPNIVGKGMMSMKGRGGSQYNVVSSEFGQIKV